MTHRYLDNEIIIMLFFQPSKLKRVQLSHLPMIDT